jgi:hypothetical protein
MRAYQVCTGQSGGTDQGSGSRPAGRRCLTMCPRPWPTTPKYEYLRHISVPPPPADNTVSTQWRRRLPAKERI